jgi:hypothetical protein
MTSARVLEPWMIEPLERFVSEADARLTLIMTPAGQVLAQYGFTRAVDVMSTAALGAAIASSTQEIAGMLGEGKFKALNHQGARHGIFLADMDNPRGRLLALVVYGPETLAGLVNLFFEDLARDLALACPQAKPTLPVLSADFERELNDSLASLFGR